MTNTLIPYNGALVGANAAASPFNSPYGQPIPRLYGVTRVKGLVMWTSPNAVVGPASPPPSSVSFAVAFGAPTPGVKSVVFVRIYVNGVLAADFSSGSAVVAIKNFSIALYTGSETQSSDPTIAKYEGKTTPGFRGLIYAVLTNFDTTPYGRTLPTIEAEIAQTAAVVSLVTPFLPDNITHSGYKLGFVDYKRLEYVSIGVWGDPLDVFDLRTNQLKFSGKTAQPINIGNNYLAVPCWNNQQPYFYATNEGLSNSEPLRLHNYESGQQVTSFGSESSTFTETSSNIAYQWCLATAPGMTGYDETVFAGTGAFNIHVLKRLGDVLSHHAVFAAGANYPTAITGQTTFDQSILNQSSIVGSTPDPTAFAISYYAIANKLYRAVATRDGASKPALLRNRFFAVWYGWELMPDPAIGTLSQGETLMLTADAAEEIDFIYTGPGANPWVSVIVRNPSTVKMYLRRYATIWGAENYDVNDVMYGAGMTSTVIDMTVFTEQVNVEIPYFDQTGYARVSKQQFNMRSGSTIMGYSSNDGFSFYSLDVYSGSYSQFTRASTTLLDSVDDTKTYDRNFQPEDFLDAARNVVYYNYDGGVTPHIAPIPGIIQLLSVGTQKLPLADYLTALCVTAGYDVADIATEGLDAIKITGSIVNTQVDLIALLSQVCGLYRIDIVETAGAIKFIKKGDGSSFAIDDTMTIDDLAQLDQSNAGELTDNTRDPSYQLPALVTVDYLDLDNANAIGAQSAKRPRFPQKSTNSTATLALSIPIIMSASEALYWANYCLFDMWNGAKISTVRVGQSKLAVECSDVVSLTLADGIARTSKVEQVQLNADFSATLQLRQFSQFKGFAQPSAIAGSVLTQTLDDNSALDVLLIDNVMVDFQDEVYAVNVIYDGTNTAKNIPYRWATERRASLYESAAMAGERQMNLRGCTGNLFTWSYGTNHGMASFVIDFLDGGTGGSYCDANSKIARATNALAAPANVHAYDTVNSITVRWPVTVPPTPIPVYAPTELDWLAGSNVLLLGATSRWECIFWSNITDNGNGTVTLSRLLRGMRGTEGHTADHAAGDYAIFLQLNYIDVYMNTVPQYGSATWTHEYVVTVDTGLACFLADTIGAQVDWDLSPMPKYNKVAPTMTSDSPTRVTHTGGPCKPFAPANVIGSYSGGDIVLDWTRVDRSGVGLHDLDGTVPLTDTPEAYSIDIWSGVAIVRTLTASSPTVTYTAANQATDGFSSPTHLHVTVYQVSAAVGRGWPRDVTIEV